MTKLVTIFSIYLLFISSQNAIAQNTNLITYGLPDSISTKLNPAINKYRSNTDFPALIDWDKSNEAILLNGGSVVYKMKNNNGEINEKYKLEQSFGEFPSPDKTKFLFLEDEDGDENFQLFLYDIKSKKTAKITEKGTRSTNPFWKPDGTKILYKSNKRKSSEADLYICNIAEPYNDKLLLENITDEAVIYDWDVATNQILFAKIISENNKELFLYNITTGRLEQINQGKSNIAYSNALFIPKKNGCLILSDEGSEFLQLKFYSFPNKTFQKIINNINWNIDEISLSKNRKYLAFTVNENGSSALYRMDTKYFLYKKINPIPEGIINNLKINNKGDKVAFNLYGSTFRRKVFSYDFNKNELSQFTNKNATPKPEFDFVKAEKILLPVIDSLSAISYTIPGFIYKPKTNSKHPVYIDIHAGPEYQALPSFNKWHQYLVNELGIAIIVPNIRGSNGYGKSYMKADDIINRENAIKDIGALLDWIATQPDLDKDRVALFGESYGGFMVLSSLAHYPDKIRCGIDVVGISNIVTYLEKTRDYRKDLRRVEFGDERNPKIRDYLLRISPANNAEKIKSPLFIVQGYNDPRVNFQESEKMVQSLQQQKKIVWYLGAKNEGHGFHKSENVAMQMNAKILFLKKYLLEN
eukprot:TRINITY_DN15224_c0_g1_i2.p1 TRINITY_DN15224_c0_g1~~TRINITY_DN15224_c0_g1_i2.p1  ORF type:complete len:641 (-),score=91.03 TRINITY_DN15224_c0_g1_i2:984-2906(-)